MAELTRQPVDRYGTDAAIFFSDIMVPAAAVGFGVDVAPGTGPVVAEPIRTEDGPRTACAPSSPSIDTPYVIEAVEALVDQLDVPLIGFAGGPFTVASYLVEGGPSKDYATVKSLMLARARALGTTWSSGWSTWRSRRCAPSSTRGPRRCRSSTRGRGS